jgi:N-acetylglucosamine-6-phosphate deacetylase
MQPTSSPILVADASQAAGEFAGPVCVGGVMRQAHVRWHAGRITELQPGETLSDESVLKGAHAFAVPGFIDTHVHGAMGRDFMEGAGAASHIAAAHARFGTTALLATTLTARFADLERCFVDVARAQAQAQANQAELLGVHLEGPYINPERLGAQPPDVRAGDAAEVAQLHSICPIRVITLAPEIAGHDRLIDSLVAQGLKVQIGHSNATYEQAASAFSRGIHGVTHVFNAMSGLHHREPGVVGAALAHAAHGEIIADTIHVHPGAIRVALRAIPGLFCVTDATSATGMPDGPYHLGSQAVHKCLGAVRLADDTLAGSALTMDQAFRNLVQALGLNLAAASDCTSTRAARYLGLSDRGQIAPQCWADLVLMNPDLSLRQVFVRGRAVL